MVSWSIHISRWKAVASSLILVLITTVACTPAAPSTPTPLPLADELTVYYWDGGMPQAIFDAFTEEYGVKINFQSYASYAEAQEQIRAGKVVDVTFLGNDFVGESMHEELLAALNLANIPNLRNVAANFRDLAFDPGNKYSIPFAWGTSGLVVRTDLFGKPVTSWNDLWAADFQKAGIWDDRRTMIGLALRSLGYSVNTETPAELEAALDRLVELKARALFMEQFDPWTSAPELNSGRIVIALGWAYDGLTGRDMNPAIAYVIPEEGAILWLENVVIPATSPHQYTAELFINFILRPEMSAQFANETYYAVTNEAAKPLIDPAILSDTIVFPDSEMLANSQLTLPLSPAVRALYDDVWARFMAAPGGMLE
ncbi:MAG: spermidine/putrescine ABC transporter substrate-binding protein [Anaerolineae bacterium]|nr:spermidine/putrescine ABC transporter substrate-binding protein [Anaerolineae bacterium]